MSARKIQVETREDIIALKTELAKAMRQRLKSNVAFQELRRDCKAQGAEGDQRLAQALRAIDQSILTWMDNLFRVAGDSIEINNLEFTEGMKRVMEPFDYELDREVKALEAEVEELTLHVVEQRKAVPARIQRLEQERSTERVRALLEACNTAPALENSAIDGEQAANLPERTLHDYAGALDGLVELKTTLPSTLAKFERIHT
ncbi:hypothetical protein IWQ60_012176, partial [Tieghemiomyces parasiticus]